MRVFLLVSAVGTRFFEEILLYIGNVLVGTSSHSLVSSETPILSVENPRLLDVDNDLYTNAFECQ